MPLQISTESPDAVAKCLQGTPSRPSFLVVYASLTNGRSWCGDCRNAEPFLSSKFAESKDVVTVVYAGQQAECVCLDLLHDCLAIQ